MNGLTSKPLSNSLSFQDACKACKPGYYFKHLHCRWNEYAIQYGRDLNGELYWTAGMTAGGPLTKKHHDKSNTGFRIYAHWGDTYPIEAHEQSDRPKPPAESFYKTPEAPLESEVSFGFLYVRKGRDEVYNTYDLDRLTAYAKERADEYPYLKFDPTGRQHLLVLSPAFHKFTPDQDKLALGLQLLKAYGRSQPKIEIPVLNPTKEVVMTVAEDTFEKTKHANFAASSKLEETEAVAEDTQAEMIKREQNTFIGALNTLVDNIAADEGTEQGHGARLAVVGVLEIIDGKDGGSGYHLVEKKDDLRLAPFSVEAYEQANESGPFMIGLDLSGSLADLFDGINS